MAWTARHSPRAAVAIVASLAAGRARWHVPTDQDLVARARAYAKTVDIAVDHGAIEWEVSERARRRAGACLYDGERDAVTIRLARRAHEAHGWAATRATIRHELIHAWEFQQFGSAGHGARFREQAARLDAPRHCEAFTDPRLRLVCENPDCDWRAGRHRASKTVTHPGPRRCGDCGGRYAVVHLASGERWTTNAGYEAARERIEEW